MNAAKKESAAALGNAEPDPRGPSPMHALKDRDTFLVADSNGDISGNSDGLFHCDTRALSRFSLRLASTTPSLLSAFVSRDNVFLTSHLLNRALPPLGEMMPVQKGVVHIERTKFLGQGVLHEKIIFTNFATAPVTLPVAFAFEADFVDLFEVRGMRRPARGRLLSPHVTDDGVTLSYEGLDGVVRTTRLAFSEIPDRLTADTAEFRVTLPAGATAELYLEVAVTETPSPSRARFRMRAAGARRAMRRRMRTGADVHASDRQFSAWIGRSRSDLALLTTDLATGPYPFAGIPWFSVPFGRDGIIAALQTLWFDPSLAHGVLCFLASTQATESSAFRDSAPGKIMHETRKDEMSALGEIPFGRYYGGIDTTPLFVVLAGAYADRTGDLEFIAKLWPSLIAAVGWMDDVASRDPRGLLSYQRGADTGLANQGWKDSSDSIFHRDGSLADGPIALVEVQGYASAAYRAMAALAERRGLFADAERWRGRAADFAAAIEDRFWMADRDFYGIALDGDGALCSVRGSNPGHLLYMGIARRDRAEKVIACLGSAAFDSGWGVRTLAADEVRFNPMSYHNGSVWPHDSALATAGMARYGARNRAALLLGEMFEVAGHFGMQLPELFCGFPRGARLPPIPYPVACLPQAWAAGSVFMMLEACLGLSIDGWNDAIVVDSPVLPECIDRIVVKSLRVGDSFADLFIERAAGDIDVRCDGVPLSRR